jgi:hypothetical protein
MVLLPQSRRSNLVRLFLSCVVLSLLSFALLSLLAAAQSRQGNQLKEVQFEVFSIRPVNGPMNLSMNTTPSPNGFDSRLSLWQAIMVAYGPGNYVNWGSVEILKAPSWIGDFTT